MASTKRKSGLDRAREWATKIETAKPGLVAGLPTRWKGYWLAASTPPGILEQWDAKLSARGYDRLTPEVWSEICAGLSPTERASVAAYPYVPGVESPHIWVTDPETAEFLFEQKKERNKKLRTWEKPRTRADRIADEAARRVMEQLGKQPGARGKE